MCVRNFFLGDFFFQRYSLCFLRVQRNKKGILLAVCAVCVEKEKAQGKIRGEGEQPHFAQRVNRKIRKG